MKNLGRCAGLIFLAMFGVSQPAECYMKTATDFLEIFQDKKIIAEVTVISAKAHVYEYGGKTYTCGTSYEARVNEIIRGALPSTIQFAEILFGLEGAELSRLNSQGRLSVLGTYLTTAQKSENHRVPSYYEGRDFLGDDAKPRPLPAHWNSPQATECLRGLPEHELTSQWEVSRYFYPNSFAQYIMGRDGNSVRAYRLMDWLFGFDVIDVYDSLWVSDDLVVGALSSVPYKAIKEFDPKAYSYLTEYGDYTVEEYLAHNKKYSPFGPPYLKNLNPQGQWATYKQFVRYDELKELIRNQHPSADK